ncbi:MAG TPA: hypothetical protein VNS19_15700 [Acidimicrobiales bacterium]|nr:hypothetical protein [Acidimicrobiales bacterium]
MADDTPGGADPGEGTTPDGSAPAGPPPGFAGGTPTPPPGFAGPGSGVGTPGGPPRGFAGADPNVVNPYSSPAYPQVPVPPARSAPAPKKGKGGLIVLAVIVIALVGGGIWFATSSGDDDASSSSDVAEGGPGAAVETYFRALEDSDWERACAVMSEELQTQASALSDGAGCAEAIAEAAEGEDPPTGVKVVSEEVTGDRAVVIAELDGHEIDYDLVREGGAWLITVRGAAATTEPSSGAPKDEIDAAEAQACELNQRTAQTAVEAYSAANGAPPPSLDALVPDYLKAVPPGLQLEGTEVTAVPGGPCA